MDFRSKGMQTSPGSSRIVHEFAQSLCYLVLVPQATRPHKGDQIVASHLRLLHLRRESSIANVLIEQLFKGSGLQINEIGVISPTDRPPGADVTRRFLEGFPMAEGNHPGYDWEGTHRLGKKDVLRFHHREQKPQHGHP